MASRRSITRYRSTLLALFCFVIGAGPALARDMCDLAAEKVRQSYSKHGTRILGRGNLDGETLKFADLQAVVPALDGIYSDWRLNFKLARFDFDGDGIPDFIVRIEDNAPMAPDLSFQVFKGIAGNPQAGQLIAKTSVPLDAEDMWFTKIEGQIYFVWEESYPEARNYRVVALPRAKNHLSCQFWASLKIAPGSADPPTITGASISDIVRFQSNPANWPN